MQVRVLGDGHVAREVEVADDALLADADTRLQNAEFHHTPFTNRHTVCGGKCSIWSFAS